MEKLIPHDAAGIDDEWFRQDNTILLMAEIDSCVAMEFVREITIIRHRIEEFGGKRVIYVIINTPGGEVFAGLDIVRAIQHTINCGFEVIGVVNGMAMSMGSIILMACSKRIASQGSCIMVHGIATQLFRGDNKDVDAEKKLMDYLRDWAVSYYLNRCRAGTYESWKEILSDKSPHYYTPNEALEAGLVDEVRP